MSVRISVLCIYAYCPCDSFPMYVCVTSIHLSHPVNLCILSKPLLISIMYIVYASPLFYVFMYNVHDNRLICDQWQITIHALFQLIWRVESWLQWCQLCRDISDMRDTAQFYQWHGTMWYINFVVTSSKSLGHKNTERAKRCMQKCRTHSGAPSGGEPWASKCLPSAESPDLSVASSYRSQGTLSINYDVHL